MSNTKHEPAPERTLARDEFTQGHREWSDHPGAVKASSRVELTDFYGMRETWILDTYRADGTEVAFLQRVSAAGAVRMVLPPKVMLALTRQHDALSTQSRRRGAQQAVATRIARGDVLGNPDALKRARTAPRRPRRARKATKGGGA